MGPPFMGNQYENADIPAHTQLWGTLKFVFDVPALFFDPQLQALGEVLHATANVLQVQLQALIAGVFAHLIQGVRLPRKYLARDQWPDVEVKNRQIRTARWPWNQLGWSR